MGKIINNQYKLIGNYENIDVQRSFNVYEIIDVTSHDTDHRRKLFRIEEDGSDKPFYRGICVSRTNLVVEQNKGKDIKEIWESYIDEYINKELLYNNKMDLSNREIEIADKIFWKNLADDGSYL